MSELTIGPAFQGNLTKILRARKQQQQQQSQVTDAPPVTTVEKSKASSPAPISSSSSSSATGSSHPLMREINEWTTEHNRYEFYQLKHSHDDRSCVFSKIEERKKLLEPQVLRIADDDDLLENDLEVDDSDEENSDGRQSNYFRQGLSIFQRHFF